MRSGPAHDVRANSTTAEDSEERVEKSRSRRLRRRFRAGAGALMGLARGRADRARNAGVARLARRGRAGRDSSRIHSNRAVVCDGGWPAMVWESRRAQSAAARASVVAGPAERTSLSHAVRRAVRLCHLLLSASPPPLRRLGLLTAEVPQVEAPAQSHRPRCEGAYSFFLFAPGIPGDACRGSLSATQSSRRVSDGIGC